MYLSAALCEGTRTPCSFDASVLSVISTKPAHSSVCIRGRRFRGLLRRLLGLRLGGIKLRSDFFLILLRVLLFPLLSRHVELFGEIGVEEVS